MYIGLPDQIRKTIDAPWLTKAPSLQRLYWEKCNSSRKSTHGQCQRTNPALAH
jgi:hypothetical protein